MIDSTVLDSSPDPGSEKMNQDKMHGSIFVFLKRYVESNYDYSTWLKLLESAKISRKSYEMHEMYPTQEIYDIVLKASEMTGASPYNLQEKFGEFLVPDLLLIYKKYINPAWKTYEMILHTEGAMHSAVKKEDGRTRPPVLFVSKVGEKVLYVDYYSKRRMAGVAIGIIKGIAKYYNESDQVKVIPLSKPEDERVQIRIEFA